MNTDKYINDIDLGRFNLFLQGNGSAKARTFYHMDNLPSIEEMFPDHIYYAILHRKNPGTHVGHWVLLTKFDEGVFEYFDCLGEEMPFELQVILDNYSELNSIPVELIESRRKLMAKTNFICGKWVMFRLMTLPNTLKEFYTFLGKVTGKKMTPDALVNFVVNIPYKEKILHP